MYSLNKPYNNFVPSCYLTAPSPKPSLACRNTGNPGPNKPNIPNKTESIVQNEMKVQTYNIPYTSEKKDNEYGLIFEKVCTASYSKHTYATRLKNGNQG
jgi:hypothetical protein